MDDLQLALLCQAIYRPEALWTQYHIVEDIHFALMRRKHDVVVFRGSANLEDWKDDFCGWPRWHPLLGFVHRGFIGGMSAVANTLFPLLGHSVYVTGHSLGAARALLFAGLMTAAGIPPKGVTVFGEPRPGFAKLRRILRAGGFPIRSYRNGADPVTKVPWLLGLYKHPVVLTPLNVAPRPDDSSPLRDHHIEHYVAGVRQLMETAA